MYGSSQQSVTLCRFEICQNSFKLHDNENILRWLKHVEQHSTLPVRLFLLK